MGSFSWILADANICQDNIVPGMKIKCLIPKEFGGGYIEGRYEDYGILKGKIVSSNYISDGSFECDLYEILAFWNAKEKTKGCESDLFLPVNENTEYNRLIGIDIGCYDEDVDKLKYPLKLTSELNDLSYEEIKDRSYGDPEQGFFPWYFAWEDGKLLRKDCRYYYPE